MTRAAPWAAALLALGLAGPAASDPPGVAPALPAVPPPPAIDAAPPAPSVDERLAEIARRIQLASRYPAIARERGVTGEALVAFEIQANGRPRGLELLSTSGSGALDRAALDAVERAAPLPFVYGRVTAPVRFTLDEAE